MVVGHTSAKTLTKISSKRTPRRERWSGCIAGAAASPVLVMYSDAVCGIQAKSPQGSQYLRINSTLSTSDPRLIVLDKQSGMMKRIWTRVYALNFCAHGRPIPTRDPCQLEVGSARLARAVHPAPTMSGGFSRSNARGRSDLHSPNDARTSQTHDSPGIRQDRRGMSAAPSPFRQNGVSRLAATGRSGFRQQIDGLGWPRANLCFDTRDPRDEARVPRAG